MLFSNLLLDICELVLQRHDDLLGDALLLLELGHAGKALLAPVLVLLAHAVDVVRHKVDALAERVRALAQDLDRLLHELDIVLREASGALRTALARRCGLDAADVFDELVLLLGRCLLLVLSDFLDDFYATAGCGWGVLAEIVVVHLLH